MDDAGPAPPCPYVGLQPFGESDRRYFFGREGDSRALASNLLSAPLTVLYGASGVGKSSVLLAGAVPALRAKPHTLVAVHRSWQGANPASALKDEIARAAAAAGCDTAGIDRSAPLDAFLAEVARAAGATVVVLLDQFEEYFLYHPESGEGSFDAQLAGAINRSDLDAGFLIALREDSLARLDRFRARIPGLMANTLRLEHLGLADAERALRMPVEVFNRGRADPARRVALEDALVRAVLTEVRTGAAGSERVEAPLLQMVMTRLWKEEVGGPGSALRLATLRGLGGARAIVQRHLEEVLDGFDAPARALCARLFDRMVTPSRAKIACRTADLAQWAGELAPQLPETLSQLAGARLLRRIAPPAEDADGEQYEIFHDVLAAPMLEWRARHLEAQRRAEAEREIALERGRADQQAQLARRMRRLAVGLALVGVAAIAATLVALQARDAAQRQTRLATSRAWAAAAINQLASDPQTGLFLALQAVGVGGGETPTRESIDALRRAQQATRLLREFPGHAQAVTDLVSSHDGSTLYSCGADGTLRAWPAQGGGGTVLLEREAGFEALASAADGSALALGGADGTLTLFDLTAGRVRTSIPAHAGAVLGVAFSADGARVASAGADGLLRLWDASGAALATLHGHRAAVRRIAFAPDGSLLASASWDGSVRLWDGRDGRALRVLNGHTEKVHALAFSPDGRLLASASQDKSIIVWRVADGEPALAPLRGHSNTVRAVAFTPDGLHVLSAGADATLRMWDRETGEPVMTIAGHAADIAAIATDVAGTRLASAGRDGMIRVWDTALTMSGPVYDVDFSADGRLMASAGLGRAAHLWDAAGGRHLRALDAAHRNTVFRVAFVPGGPRVVSADLDGLAVVWDAATGARLFELRGHRDAILGLALSRDGRRIATAGRDETVRLWDATDGTPVTTLHHHGARVRAVAFSPDGARLASASSDGSVVVSDAASGARLFAIEDRATQFFAVAFSPDGRQIATGSSDKAVRLWDAQDGAPLRMLTGHTETVVALAYDRNGRRLASASWDRSARLWDATDGRELAVLPPHESEIHDLTFTPDGRYLATAGQDRMVRLHPLAVADLIAAARAKLVRSFADEDCARLLDLRRCPPLP